MKVRSIQTMEQELDKIAEENPCLACGSTNQEVRPIVTRSWRGWEVTCLDCGEVNEYDEIESLAEHRSV